MVDIREWSRDDTAALLRVPTSADDKYTRGVVALRTGSSAYPGAAVLGVEAAWRSGAGFVRYIGDARAADAVLARRPETVVGADAGRTRVDAWVIGSGTDPRERTHDETEALRGILDGSTPVVADAGALDLVAGVRAPLVITPHAAEFSRLQVHLGLDPHTQGVEASVAAASAALGAIVVRKGARTLIADPDGVVRSVTESSGWASTAGTGDVLAGVIGAIIAADPARPLACSAAAGVWIHGRAARVAAGEVDGAAAGNGHPIVALDVAQALPAVIGDLLA